MLFKMYSVEKPRTPPPSRDSRHSPVLSTGSGSPPCFVDVACSMARLTVGVVLGLPNDRRSAAKSLSIVSVVSTRQQAEAGQLKDEAG